MKIKFDKIPRLQLRWIVVMWFAIMISLHYWYLIYIVSPDKHESLLPILILGFKFTKIFGFMFLIDYIIGWVVYFKYLHR